MPSTLNHHLRPRRCALGVALAATAAIGAAGLTGPAQAAPAPASASTSTVPNVAVEWNRTLLDLVQKPGAQPPTIQPTRDFAILGSAVYDAVQAVDRHRHSGQVTNAAAAQAAHDVLTATFPSFGMTLNQQLASDLAAVHSGRARAEGVRAGADAAAAVLHARADDGSGVTPPPYQTSGLPGDFRPTPPAFAAPVFTHWGAVTPFVLRSGDQFRPPAPPSLRSRAYAAAVNEVKALGRDTSTLRTAEQTTIARFWAGPIQNYWYAIADEIAVARHEDTATSARTFALLDLAVADATIALYDAKYTYRLWRPIDAIRFADTDANPRTHADPAWTPLATTPADPSYPGAHSTISAAAATVLAAVYGDRVSFTVTSPVLAGVTRSFHDFGDAATEAGLSRIFAGIHTRLDHRAGVTLGRDVGRFTLRHALRDVGR